jgi:hypothetical protein
MSTPHMDTILGRLDRLEREVRRWRVGATILFTCVIAAFVMGQTLPKPQVIEAQRFILKNPDGKVHAILGLHSLIYDAPSAEKSYLEPSEAMGGAWGLHIFGSEGKYRAGLTLQRHLSLT